MSASTQDDINKRMRKQNESFKTLKDAELLAVIEANLMNASNIVGLFYPTVRAAEGYHIEHPAEVAPDPVPPTALRHYYGRRDGKFVDELYLKTGQNDIASMRRVACRDGFDLAAGPILEFGCSAGRLLRHLRAEAERTECWGVDIHADAIHWAQGHLSPPFNFALTTTNPHLPFDDRYFNFIFAGSVFTHLGEIDDAWLLELRRILRPGGRMYLTVSDENTLKVIRETAPTHESNKHVDEYAAASGVFDRPWVQFVTRTTPWLQRNVYHRDRWLAKIGRWLNVVEYRQQAYGWQSAVLLERKA